MADQQGSGLLPDEFDRARGGLSGVVTQTREVTVPTVPLFGIGGGQTWVIQTLRQQDVGDVVLIQLIGQDRSLRLVLPPKVTATIARQRDSLTSRSRQRAAKAAAQTRKAKGIKPAFLKAVR